HMLFKGTETRSASEVAQQVQAQGGYVNAYTSFDRTVYWIDSPASGANDCLDILCDVIANSKIPEDEFLKEQEVIRREFAMGGDNPDQVLSKMLFANAYTKHPCRHPVIGHIDLFNQLKRDGLYDYYRSKYSPDNLFFVIVGDVDAAEMRERIAGHMGDLPRRRMENLTLPAEPPQLGGREEIRPFPTDLSRSRICWSIPDVTHPDVPALDLMADVLGAGRSSRLYREVRDQRQLAHQVYTYAYTPAFDGVFVLGVESDPDKLEQAEEASLAEIEKLKTDGISEDELAKVKRQTLCSQFSTLTDMRGQASDLGSNWLMARNLDLTRYYVQQTEKLTSEQLVESARKYLDRDNSTRVALVPEEEAATADVGAASKRSEDFRKVELANGLTVLLLADQRLPFVQSISSFRGGRLAETEETNGVTSLLGRLLTKDSSNRSAEEVADAIESVGGGISASMGNNTFGVSVGALKTDFDLVLDLLHGATMDAALLDDRIEIERGFQLAQIKAEADRPFSVAMKRLRRELYGPVHPYGLEGNGTEISVGGLQKQHLLDQRARLVKGGNGIVGVFGDIDLDHAEDQVRARFESMAAGDREFTQPITAGIPESYGQIVEQTHDKEQAILLIGFPTCDLAHEDNLALGMIDEACSDMASRMFIRIREELGLAYSVGSSRMLGLAPGYLMFYVATDPEKLDLVQQEMLDEVDLIAREGIAQDEFDRAKASWLGRDAINLQGVRELAGIASIDELVGLGWDNYRKTPGMIADLSRDTVADVAAKYLQPEKRVIVRLTTS
ncbi:MAG: pitrilysin family protein, partial [Verrucomicrobiota bacterium]